MDYDKAQYLVNWGIRKGLIGMRRMDLMKNHTKTFAWPHKTVEEVFQAVMKAGNLREENLINRSKEDEYTRAKHIFCFAAVHRGNTRNQAAERTKRERSSVSHSIYRAMEMINGGDPQAAALLTRVNEILDNGQAP